MTAFTLDTKNTDTLTTDSRSANGTFTVDSHASNPFLWTSAIFPWTSTILPWLISGTGQILTQDIRN